QQDPRVVANAVRFTEVTAPAGIVATALGVLGFGTDLVARPVPAAVGDYDNDGHLDVFAAGALFHNKGDDTFSRTSAISDSTSGAAFFADLDHDGDLDLFVAGRLYRNNGDGSFTQQTIAPGATHAVFGDFDGDPRIDLIVENNGTLTLYRGSEEGRFEAHPLPIHATAIAAADYDNDGFLDLVVVGLDGRVRVLRNDGGNANQFVNVGLVALRDGSGKNNTFGIGSHLELRAGDLYQMRTVDQPVMHFGLGNHLKADVLRVVWTNGVPQSFYYPVSQSMLEQQVLKGSCTFLYTWDGQAYHFLTDVTWASALGMPLGIMAGEKTIYGPPQAAVEYFRIPGDRLKPAHGRYRMQLTEELWEVAYVDQLALLAVDHP